jgi:hypothetical protein
MISCAVPSMRSDARGKEQRRWLFGAGRPDPDGDGFWRGKQAKLLWREGREGDEDDAKGKG